MMHFDESMALIDNLEITRFKTKKLYQWMRWGMCWLKIS